MIPISTLPTPIQIKKELAPSQKALDTKRMRDADIKMALLGKSKQKLLIIGPCSAHCYDAVMEYMSLLAPVAKSMQGKFIVIPRVYTAKPRTQGVGYMGMLHEPNGLQNARKLHLDILEQFGLSCADELLYPSLLPYFDDIVSYFAIGARSVQNQEHRLVASGMHVPVGIKNPLSGDLNDLVAAVGSAQSPHGFIFRDNFVKTSGNPLAHGILRGAADAPNYAKANELNIPIIIDASHGNSCKNPLNQLEVATEAIKMKNVRGVMVESFTHPGQSITDPCLTWEQTKALVLELAGLIN